MNGPALALIVLVLLSGRPTTVWSATPADQTPIRDIRDPLPPSGLPPFTGTVLILLVSGLGLAVTTKTRKRRSRTVVSSPVRPSGMDDLAALRIAYAREELSAPLLFQRMAGIARSRLVQDNRTAMTSAEVLEAAGKTAPTEMLSVAATLFAMCDRVRFGGYQPDTAAVAEAFAALQLLLQRPPETSP